MRSTARSTGVVHVRAYVQRDGPVKAYTRGAPGSSVGVAHEEKGGQMLIPPAPTTPYLPKLPLPPKPKRRVLPKITGEQLGLFKK